ncbi:MAG TPA: hypothetical protein VD860_10090 [Azospirillum sp.]|nr:hypothetical protein [Azospirillum sp.]
MKARSLVLAATAAVAMVAVSGVAAAQKAPQGTTVSLGGEARVKALYSWPNTCSDVSVCGAASIEDTVRHYLEQSLKRDGYADSTVTVRRTATGYQATFTGSAQKTYPKAVAAFLNAGDKALATARSIAASKTPEGASQWPYSWRFFLPVGLAMVNNPTVELLHFPPDYSLTDKQDYLNSATTDRWAMLLAQNGIPADKSPAYQAIIDINPIAAPASDGKKLEGVEGKFTSYITDMLGQWTSNPATPYYGKPMVAFGGPVRAWLKAQYGLELQVDQVGLLSLPSGVVPVIAANHPSQIFYTAWNDTTPKTENFEKGMQVMTQDLIAACWQARMGQAPASDPQKTAADCTQQWVTNNKQVCTLLETTIYKKTEEQAQAICSALPPVAQGRDGALQAASLAD